MTWTRINPEDLKTYPETYDTVVFEGRWLDARVRCVGYWSGKSWLVLQGGELPPERVPRWSAIPALPGEEAESKTEHPAELVERVAKAVALNVLEQAREMGEEGTADYDDLPETGTDHEPGKETFRRIARAALEAIRPAEVSAWHERPTSPGWWMRHGEWFMADAESVEQMREMTFGDPFFGPVVVPEQEKLK